MAFRARKEGLLVKHLNDETVIYDLAAHRAHRLDPIASRVWTQCDGTREIPQVAAAAGQSSGGHLDEALVAVAIEELAAAGLMEGDLPPRTSELSRRSLFQRLGIASAAVLVLPLVTSIVTPKPAAAQSAVPPPAPPPPPVPHRPPG
jgi:hypothetical protein